MGKTYDFSITQSTGNQMFRLLALGTQVKEGKEDARFHAQLNITCSPLSTFEVEHPAFLEPWHHEKSYTKNLGAGQE